MEQVDVHHVVLSSGVVFDVILNFIPEILLHRKKKEKSVGFFFCCCYETILEKNFEGMRPPSGARPCSVHTSLRLFSASHPLGTHFLFPHGSRSSPRRSLLSFFFFALCLFQTPSSLGPSMTSDPSHHSIFNPRPWVIRRLSDLSSLLPIRPRPTSPQLGHGRSAILWNDFLCRSIGEMQSLTIRRRSPTRRKSRRNNCCHRTYSFTAKGTSRVM